MSWPLVVILFFLGVLALAGALTMVLQQDPIRSALGLLVTMLGLGIIYLLLAAPFVGFVQLVVYAGAIVVLFLLALMNFPVGELAPDRLRGTAGAATLGLVLLGVYLQQVIIQAPLASQTSPVDGSPEGIGRVLMTDYLYLFELASILLLVALVSAIFLTREREPAEDFEHDPDELPAPAAPGGVRAA
ncbi:MAG TPA: NADH-quinone oxidoreductase subunit J [bacterium]|nr:NADH-quinone oxidoreductase subunit J [bacterium]